MADSEDATVPPAGSAEQTGPSKSELKKRQKELEKQKKKEEAAARQAEQAKARAAADVDYAEQNYGKLPLNQSQERIGRNFTRIETLSAASVGQTVFFRARVHTSRAQGNKMVFFKLRQRTNSIQGVLMVAPEKVSKQMVKWAAGVTDESIVLVEGTIQLPQEEVKSTSVSDAEVLISKIHIESEVEGGLPFTLDDASRPEADFEHADAQYNRVNRDTRLNNRVLDLRTQTNQAIFKLQAAVADMFRNFLTSQGFTNIYSPKLQGAATESGASVFKVSYFKGDAYLAQSPQLAKQMAIAADFERVFEIGPVFRAENSFTHRHMTEFIGLDLEMTINEHYHEVMELLDSLFLTIFRGLRDNYSKEIAIIRQQFPADDFKWREGPEGTLKLTFAEAVDMLVEDGVDRSLLDDIDTENEKRLGVLVKAKYDTDYYIIDKFPMELRPFYTMRDPVNPMLSNSYDFFMRGEEMLSGAQRIHEPHVLIEEMKKKGIDPESMKHYVEAFRLGCPPHGGGGIGLERVVMLFLKLDTIKRASLFPRDPKRLEP